MTATAESVVLAAAALGALVVLWRALRGMVRSLDALADMPARMNTLTARMAALERLVTKELTHNHGSSIKDDVVGLAVSMGHLGRATDELRHDLDSHLTDERNPR